MFRTILAILLLIASGCSVNTNTRAAPASQWAIAIHGGAGAINRGESAQLEAAYRDAMENVLREGERRLAAGESSLDVCEALVCMMEDDELFNAGKGATLTERGTVELDAAIMDGGKGGSEASAPRAGAVASVTTVKNPISLARIVMQRTPHVLLVGPGADDFAERAGVERVPNSYFITERRRRQLEAELEKRRTVTEAPAARKYGTVGVVALDTSGRLAAATSTGGMTGKMPGRVGDAPIIGAGTYANDLVAVSCTGTGEQFIRNAVASGVATRMRLLGEGVQEASDYYIFKGLKPRDGGLIALDAHGNIAMPYSSAGMYRGSANSEGRFEVRIWED
ncbi:MAG: isoaspartyl peptidase/L-asparaginase [Phycisphaeraceae bacterium]|nr:isoaspartyl peptidase/L-asparaginase [Phycisphaeraceae bacterium]